MGVLRKNLLFPGQLRTAATRSAYHVTDNDIATVRPANNLSGSVRLPGDKSISHRYAMLGAIAEGQTQLENFSSGADCASTLSCLRALGCLIESGNNAAVKIHGKGPALSAPATPLDCGNSGSTMRMLAGILAGQDFSSELIGDKSLSRRPMERIVTPLTSMGAVITATENYRPPLHIRGGRLHGIDYRIPVPSAQVKTALLLAALLAKGETQVEEPVRTRDHGEIALRAFGASLQRRSLCYSLAGGQKLHGISAVIPGDISSAAFFLCAAALFPDCNLILDQVLLNPTRAAILDLLVSMGLSLTILQVEDQHGELVGTVRVQHGGRLRGGRISGVQTAVLIDELPVLAAIAPYTENGIEIRDARELRVKESDRIAAMAENLRAFGARVEVFDDGLRVAGGQPLHGAEVESFGDHRVAMACAVAALRAQGDTRISNAQVVDISYPGFFATLENLLQH
jgi:3-phosphoshikimate 1-carboxyvinyltransferase